MIGGLGYLLQSPSPWNATIDAIAISWQIVRINAEERHLEGPAYLTYRKQVPWRLFPGLW